MDTAQKVARLPWQLLRGVLTDVEDDALRDSVLEMFVSAYTDIAAGRLEVCVFATQRVSNLYFALTEYGLPKYECLIVTHDDPQSQLPFSEWEGKRVGILDDTILLGSSLCYTVRDIRELVGVDGSVEVRAACVDSEASAPQLLQYLSPAHAVVASHESTLQLSADLSAVVYQSLVPPMGDFFSTERLAVDADILDSGLSVRGWEAFDVTTPCVSRDTTFAYTFIPNTEMRLEISRAIDAVIANGSEYIALIKVRVLGRLMGRVASIRVVPVLVVDPIESRATADILERIESLLGSWPHRVATQKWSDGLQHRVLQLMLSGMVAMEFNKALNAGVEFSAQDLLDRLDVKLLETNFGTGPTQFIAKSLVALFRLRDRAPSLPSLTRLPLPTPAGTTRPEFANEAEVVVAALGRVNMGWSSRLDVSGSTVHIGSDFVHAMAGLFGQILLTQEDPEREHIRSLSIDEFFDQFPDRSRRTINKGITLNGLAQIVRKFVDSDVRARDIASLAIDVLFDSGIVLSLTVVDIEDKSVSRKYVLGENAWLAHGQLQLTYFETTEVY